MQGWESCYDSNYGVSGHAIGETQPGLGAALGMDWSQHPHLFGRPDFEELEVVVHKSSSHLPCQPSHFEDTTAGLAIEGAGCTS
jgi:hypothetical protein